MLAVGLSRAADSARPAVAPAATMLDIRLAGNWNSRNVSASLGEYRGRQAIRVVGTAGDDVVDKLAVIPLALEDGEIEIDAAGFPEPGQPDDARSYFGIAFRASADLSRFEALYIRPENARANDHLRRNRSTQYIAFPNRPWQKLRGETPGKYESHVDLAPGQWIRLRVQLEGGTARLYVNDAAEPALLVTDLEGDRHGRSGLALWIGNRTIAYFTGIKIRARRQPKPPAATP